MRTHVLVLALLGCFLCRSCLATFDGPRFTRFRLRVVEVGGGIPSPCMRDSLVDSAWVGRLVLYDKDGAPIAPPGKVSFERGTYSFGASPGAWFDNLSNSVRNFAFQTDASDGLGYGATFDFEYSRPVAVASYALHTSLGGSALTDPTSWQLLALSPIGERWVQLDAQFNVAPPGGRGALYATYTTVFCGTNLTRCASCDGLIDTRSCGTCTPGWTTPWQTCAVPTDPCAASPCLNGGLCFAEGGMFNRPLCLCPAGFTGPTCGTLSPGAPAECDPASCVAGCTFDWPSRRFRCPCSSPLDACAGADSQAPVFLAIESGLEYDGLANEWVFSSMLDDANTVLTLAYSEPVWPGPAVESAAFLYNASDPTRKPVLWPFADARSWLKVCVNSSLVELRVGWQAIVQAVVNGTISHGARLTLALGAGLVRDAAGNPSVAKLDAITFTVTGLCGQLAPSSPGQQVVCYGMECRAACDLGYAPTTAAAPLVQCLNALTSAYDPTPRACALALAPTISSVVPMSPPAGYLGFFVVNAPPFPPSALNLPPLAHSGAAITYLLVGAGFGVTPADLLDVSLVGEDGLGNSLIHSCSLLGWTGTFPFACTVPSVLVSSGILAFWRVTTRTHGVVMTGAPVVIINFPTTGMVLPTSGANCNCGFINSQITSLTGASYVRIFIAPCPVSPFVYLCTSAAVTWPASVIRVYGLPVAGLAYSSTVLAGTFPGPSATRLISLPALTQSVTVSDLLLTRNLLSTGQAGGCMFAERSAGSGLSLNLRRIDFLGCQAAHGGALSTNNVGMNLLDCTFELCAATSVWGNGGAILFTTGSTDVLVIIDSTSFKSCSAGESGGAIYLNMLPLPGNPTAQTTLAGSHVIENCLFSYTGASTGSGGSIYANVMPLILRRNLFNSTAAGHQGGALRLLLAQVPLVPRSIFCIMFGNTFLNGGAGVRGGLLSLYLRFLVASFNEFDGGVAQGAGGCIAMNVVDQGIEQALLRFNDNSLANCLATQGGGMLVTPDAFLDDSSIAPFSMNGNHFTRCSASFGGAVMIESFVQISHSSDNIYSRNVVISIAAGLYLGIDVQMTLERELFVDNFCSQVGGAVFAYAKAAPTFVDSTFISNTALNRGGAILMLLGELNVQNCLFERNGAGARGGAVSVVQAYASISSSHFVSNVADSLGGALEAQDVVARVTQCVFSSNLASVAGGAISSDQGCSMTVTACNFTDNQALDIGGAIAAYPIVIDACRFTGNSARTSGGALHFAEPLDSTAILFPRTMLDMLGTAELVIVPMTSIDVSRIVVQDNSAGRDGGAIAVATRTLPAVLREVTIARGYAGAAGGGLALLNAHAVQLSDVTIVDSIAQTFGGAVYISPGSRDISISRLSASNCLAAKGDGGALALAELVSSVRMGDLALHACRAAINGGALAAMSPLLLDGPVNVSFCSATAGGGVHTSAAMLVASGTSPSHARLSIANCSATYGGGLFIVATNGTVPPVSLTGVSVAGSQALIGGGGVYYCFVTCLAPSQRAVPRTAPRPSAWLVPSTSNSADYGPFAASDGVALRWRSDPRFNVTAGTILLPVSSETGRTDVVLEAVLYDAFNVQVASEFISKNAIARIALQSANGTALGGSAALALGGTIVAVASGSGVMQFPAVSVEVDGATQASETLDRLYRVHVSFEEFPEVSLSTDVRIVSCPSGTVRTNETSGSMSLLRCQACAAGSYSQVDQAGQAATSCKLCPPGTFSPTDGLAQCTNCAAGTFAASAGQKVCQACKAGDYSLERATACDACPSGGFCLDGQLLPSDGWWSPALAGYSTSAKQPFFSCPNPFACVRGVCAKPYEGPLCNRCMRRDEAGNKYARIGQSCSKCPSDRESIAMVCLGLIAVLFVMVYFIRSATKSKSEISILLKVSIDYMQMLALVAEFTSSARSTFARFFNFTRSASTSINVFPILCLWNFNFYRNLLMSMLFPPAAVVVFAFIYASAYLYNLIHMDRYVQRALARLEADAAKTAKTLELEAVTAIQAAASRAEQMALRARLAKSRAAADQLLDQRKRLAQDNALPNLRNEYYNRFVSSLSVVYFLAYPSIVRTLLQVYHCVAGLNVLVADVSISCGTPTHRFYMALTAAALLLYAIIIPGVAFVLLQRNRVRGTSDSIAIMRAEMEQDRRTGRIAATHLAKMERYRFLIDGYMPHAIYWEMVTISRKTFICVILVFFSERRLTQAGLGTFLLMGYSLLQVYIKPFVKVSLNLAEFCALTTLVISLAGSIAFISDNSSTKARAEMDPNMSMALILLNVAFIVSVLVYALRFLTEQYYALRSEKGRLAQLATVQQAARRTQLLRAGGAGAARRGLVFAEGWTNDADRQRSEQEAAQQQQQQQQQQQDTSSSVAGLSAFEAPSDASRASSAARTRHPSNPTAPVVGSGLVAALAAVATPHTGAANTSASATSASANVHAGPANAAHTGAHVRGSADLMMLESDL